MSILTSPEDWKTKWPRASIGNSINQMKRGAQGVNPLERLFLLLPPRDSNPDNVIQRQVSYHGTRCHQQLKKSTHSSSSLSNLHTECTHFNPPLNPIPVTIHLSITSRHAYGFNRRIQSPQSYR